MLQLTKSDYMEFRDCWKSFWLKRNRPNCVRWRTPSPYDRLLMADGYALEAAAVEFIKTWKDAQRYSFQKAVSSPDGLKIRTDVLGLCADGSHDLIEIKASTSVAHHLIDVCFQVIAAERAELEIKTASIMHIDKEYQRGSAIEPADLFKIVDVSTEVAQMRAEVEADVAAALAVLNQSSIDEDGCDCRTLGRGRHCEAFGHFNPGLEGRTAYMLPHISTARLRQLDDEDRLAIELVTRVDVTATQLPVWQALKQDKAIVDHAALEAFLSSLNYPLHFYDYETFASAIPAAPGFRPHQAMPVQFSLHVLQADGTLIHSEYLADGHGTQSHLVEHLDAGIATSGDAIVWNESFEKGCNVRMAELLPHHAKFLTDLNDRTIDLMTPFKHVYVDPGFEGSVSIKKVLPILCPDLDYSQNEVSDGAGAMAAFAEMITTTNQDDRERLKSAMLSYCKLDTIAMVRIFQFLQRARLKTEAGE